MAVEKVLVPVRAVFGVGELGVETHERGEQLGNKEDGETDQELRVESTSGVRIRLALHDAR